MAATATANQAILTRLQSMPQYHPVTGTLFADWTLDPGDVVAIKQGDTSYAVPVFQMNLDWKGKSTVEVQSTGSEKRPPLSALKRNSYGGGRTAAQVEDMEIEMVRHQADITKNNERIAIWATEEEWSTLKEEYQTTHSSQLEVTAKQISSVVTGVEAGTFNKNQNYAIGNFTVRNGKVYRFIAPHVAGTDWNFNEVEEAANFYGSLSSHSSRITQTENSISLVVDQNGIRRGQIILAINNRTGASDALIEADKVQITGNTTLSGTLEIDDDGRLHVGRNILVGTVGTNVQINGGDGKVFAKTFQVSSANGSGIVFSGSGTGEHYDLTASNVKDLHSSAAIANDTLTVGKLGGGSAAFTIAKSGNDLVISAGSNSITFNRAVAPYIDGYWDDGVYHVTSDVTPAATSVMSTTLWTDINPGTPWASGVDGKNISVSYDIGWQENFEGQLRRGGSTGRTGTLTLSNVLQPQVEVTPTTSDQTISPTGTYLGLQSVKVKAASSTTRYVKSVQIAPIYTGGNVSGNRVVITFTSGSGQTYDTTLDTVRSTTTWTDSSR